MKILLALLAFVLLAGCASQTQLPPDVMYCESDADCVPVPMCHPDYCINEKYNDNFETPQICTEIYKCNAAYNKEDCVCRNNQCYNLRLEDPNC